METFYLAIVLIIIALISIGMGLYGVITAKTIGFGYKYTGRNARFRGILAILGGTGILLMQIYVLMTRT